MRYNNVFQTPWSRLLSTLDDNGRPPLLLISIIIGLIFFCRVFGFMSVVPLLIPSIALYKGATLLNMGIAIGIYGFMQFLFQIGFGALSDIYGRKKIIALGLLMLALGSVVCSQADSIQALILGRLLQGAGAIGSTCMALLADYIAVENRSIALMIVGLFIGVSFSISIVLGPILKYYYGMHGLFLIVGLLALLAISLLYTCLPSERRKAMQRQAIGANLIQCISNYYLLVLNGLALLIHLLFTGLFAMLPYILLQEYNYHLGENVWMYNGFMLGSFVLSFIFIAAIRRCKDRRAPIMMACAVMSLGLIAAAYFHSYLYALMTGFSLFLIGFNLLESLIPSQVTIIAPDVQRGAAMGLYSSHQYLGIFLGGIISGYLLHHHTILFTLSSYAAIAFVSLGLVLLLYRLKNIPDTVLT